MYVYCALNTDKIESITHKFLVLGHTQNEGDSMHATIEREKKRVSKSGPIYVPAQWATIIQGAKKSGTPYKVSEMCNKDMFDFKALSTQLGQNYTINEDNEKVVWNDIKLVRVEKEKPYIIFYKTSYEQEHFKSINIKSKVRGINKEQKIELIPAYKNAPPIAVAKKQHLLELCRDNSIKQVDWPFYENLRAHNNVETDCESECEEEINF